MRISWLVALCLLCASPAAARPYGIDDLLRLESYGQVAVAPGGAFAIVEKRDRYDSAEDYSLGFFAFRLLTKLYRLDPRRGGALVPLIDHEPGFGYTFGSFSRSGRRALIYRLGRSGLRAGIVELASGGVRWLPFTPDQPVAQPRALWLDDDRLVFARLPDGHLPYMLGYLPSASRLWPKLWKRQAEGREPSAVVLGSGRYRDAGIAAPKRTVILFDLASGMERTLMRAEAADMALSEDRRYLAVVAKDGAASPTEDRLFDTATRWRRERLHILDLESGAAWPVCAGCDIMSNLLSWDGRSAQLLVYARKDGSDWAEGALYRIDPSSRTATALTGRELRPVVDRGGGDALTVHAGWLAGEPVVRARMKGGRAEWYRLARGGAPQALTAALPAETGTIAHLGAGFLAASSGGGLWRGGVSRPWDRVAARIERIGPTLLDPHFEGTRPLYTRVLTGLPSFVEQVGEERTLHIPRGRGKAARCSLGSPRAQVLATGLAGSRFIAFDEGSGGPGRLLLIACNGPGRTLDTINRHLEDVEPAPTVALTTKALDGARLTHWLYLPTTPSSSPPPLVVLPYPGQMFSPEHPPWPLVSTMAGMVNPHLLAARGYAVLRPSQPISAAPGDTLEPLARDVVAAVDAAAALGLVDGRRVAAYGHSYGGYAALGLAATTRRFSAVIASAGLYDLAADYGHFELRTDYLEAGLSPSSGGYFEGEQGRMGGPPWANPARYVSRSP